MKVLVTGAAGFIGSHLVEELLAHGHSVRALVRYNSESRIGNLAELDRERWGERLEIVFGDVRDARQLAAAAAGAAAAAHLAALIGIPYSYQAPQSYLDTNLGGTLNLLEAARAGGVGRVVVTSTSEVYGTALYTPIDERHPLQAQSPYSASKIAADKLAESYACSFGLPVVVLRPFNTYGPRQSERAVLPAILAQLAAGRRRLALGSLAPRRDLVFVGDTVRAFRLALERPGIEGETIHCGSGRAVSVAELAELAMAVTGVRAEIVEEAARVRPAASEVELLVADSRRAEELLGWRAETSLEAGMVAAWDHVRAHPERYDGGRYAT